MQQQTLEKIADQTILSLYSSMIDTLQILDVQFLEIIRNFFMIDANWFRLIVRLFADSEPIIFSLFLVGLWFSGVYQKNNGPKHVALDLFWHVLGAFMIYWVINQLLPLRPRPEGFSTLPPLLDHLPDNSFPSGHAMFWWASWWALRFLLRRPWVTVAFFILGLITCLTRIIAGIHYPGDIIVGFFLWWTITELLLRLPHDEKYRRYAHDFSLRLAKYFWL